MNFGILETLQMNGMEDRQRNVTGSVWGSFKERVCLLSMKLGAKCTIKR